MSELKLRPLKKGTTYGVAEAHPSRFSAKCKAMA
jgi:hypothetical protein